MFLPVFMTYGDTCVLYFAFSLFFYLPRAVQKYIIKKTYPTFPQQSKVERRQKAGMHVHQTFMRILFVELLPSIITPALLNIEQCIGT